MNSSACCLDCYDSCEITLDKKGSTSFLGNKALCKLINHHIKNSKRVEKAFINGKEVSIEEALNASVEAFKENTLFWKGSGNRGAMQDVTNLFMQKIDATTTKGSLCDGAGEVGILEGRGENLTLPLKEIKKAQTVVVWGRNLTVTNSHLLEHIKDKDIITIDPVKTQIAKISKLHLQIRPRTDYYLAIVLARFIFMQDIEDKEWLEEFAPDFEDFYDYTREHRIKAILEYIGLELGDMGRTIELLENRKVVFLVGIGVQKYSIGKYVLQAIDSLASVLGLFGKEGCGVHYLGTSFLGVKSPFEVNLKKVSKTLTPFSKFSTVLVQGGNPLESMPDTNRVLKEIEEVKTLIYFGLYENETSKKANIVIPAKNFFEKDDVLFSYGHNGVFPIRKIEENSFGISEYDFTNYLLEAFGFNKLKSEKFYIDNFLSQCKKENNLYLSPSYEEIPYKNGFKDNEEFNFIDDFDDDFVNIKRFRKYRKKKEEIDNTFWLISTKSKNSLNTQFQRDNRVFINPSLGYKDNEQVLISSEYGEAIFTVESNRDIREDSILITNNSYNLNKLTPSIEEDNNACYGEVKVTIEKRK